MNNKKFLAIAICFIIALIATYLGGIQKIVGAPMLGLIIGMIIVNLMPSVDKDFKSGTTFAGKKFLCIGIILTGATLNFNKVLGYGAKAMPLLLFNICIAFIVAHLLGRYLKLSFNTSSLVASGSSICGGTAIATISSIIKAKESEIAYAMTAIFLFDIFAALVYPYFAGILNLTSNQFCFLAGFAINDTSSVVAAESTYNVLNGINSNMAVTIKLARTTLLILLVIIFTILTVKKNSETTTNTEKVSAGTSVAIKENSETTSTNNTKKVSIGRTVVQSFPKFIIVFLIMAVLNTIGIFDVINGSSTFFSKSSKFFITTALAGVGFKIQFRDLFTKGLKPILLGGFTWLAVATSSLIFITVFAGYVG